MTQETEGNPLRKLMVRGVVQQHSTEPLTVEHLAQYLPDGFDLGDDDLEPYRQTEFEGAPEAQATTEAAPAVAESAEAETPAPTAEEIEAATVRRIEADQALANARVAVIAAQNAERDARGKLAEAVTTFQKGFPPMTPEQLRREHVHEQTEIRRKIASGEMPGRPGPKVGKSAVDRMAFYQRGGNPAGGGRAYARGALPASAYGRSIPKVPSER